MSAFNWNTSWCHVQESFWSLANKLAFANSATVAEVLVYLGGVVARHRDALLFPGMRTAMTVATTLELDSGRAARSMFAGVATPQPLFEREHWHLGIRYCRRCIDGFVHRTYFQDTRHDFCELHGERLVDACLHCGRRLDPLCAKAWHCNFCGCPIVVPGPKWFCEFREEPATPNPNGFGVAPTPGPSAEPFAPVDCAGRYLVDRNWLADIAFEEHAAFTHSLLSEHRDCLADESTIGTSEARLFHFHCPVAAAAISSAASLGIAAQGVDGGWPQSRPLVCGSSALNQLEYFLSGISRTEHPWMIRGAVQGWYVEALEVFIGAALAGNFTARWTPSETAKMTVKAGPTEVLQSGDIWAKTEQLVASAGHGCALTAGARRLANLTFS